MADERVGMLLHFMLISSVRALPLVRVMPAEGALATAGLWGAVEDAQGEQRRHHHSHACCGPQAGCPPRYHQGGA